MNEPAVTRRRWTILAGVGAVAAMIAGCTGAPGAPEPPSATAVPTAVATTAPAPDVGAAESWRTTPEIATLATGLAAPWSVVPLAEGGALISQRDEGTIVHLGADGSQVELADIPDVRAGGEAGLHGLAVREADDERWLYAYHGAASDNRVVRMPLTGQSETLAAGPAEPVFVGIPLGAIHNGGRIAFGPDDLLYVATGDVGEPALSQDASSLAGKILRLTPDGEAAPGNPFDDAVYALGLRNPQGLAWTSDGAMYASEFGPNTWDELNRIEAGGNYGWPEVEGTADDPQYVDPVAQWSPAEASPSGIAAVGNTVFVTGLRGAQLWAVDVDGAEVPAASLTDQGRLRDAVAAPDGSLWVLTNNTDGRGSPRADDDVLLRVTLEPLN